MELVSSSRAKDYNFQPIFLVMLAGKKGLSFLSDLIARPSPIAEFTPALPEVTGKGILASIL
jgi:hypothetical protein